MEEEVKAAEKPAEVVKAYPIVEEMTFRGIIRNESEGYALLRAVQILVNELGTDTIIKIVAMGEKNPNMLQKIKTYLPYL